MRIAFSGKGGSGKSTLAASFASFLSQQSGKTVVAFDADLNIHMPRLLGFEDLPAEKHLSHPEVAKKVKQWLAGGNEMPDLGAFRKTTPPTRKSALLKPAQIGRSPLADFSLRRENLSLLAVGSYQKEGIGASCYHNSLSILESLLNHTDDKDSYIVADMVAGVDSFAGTLHAQFDLSCLIVEPTARSIEVYQKYSLLAQSAGVIGSLAAIGNKIRSEADKEFIAKRIDSERILGYFSDDQHLRSIDQDEGRIEVEKLDPSNQALLRSLAEKIDALPDSRNERLRRIWELHRKYVGQDFVRQKFGDLNRQIDPDFIFGE